MLAVVAIGAQLVVGLGAFWPLAVVGAYGVGALIAPRDRVDLRLGLGAGATAEQLASQLKVLRRSLRAEASRLDDDAEAVVTRILAALEDIVARFDELAVAPDQRHTVEMMIGDYLPTSLQRYLNLPRTFAVSTRVAGRRTAHEELMEQLALLEKESSRIRDAVLASEVDALSDQSRFLREKFGTSELEL